MKRSSGIGETEPNTILLVYEPKSSGKTTLLMKAAEELSKLLMVQLERRIISRYDSVLKIFLRLVDFLRR